MFLRSLQARSWQCTVAVHGSIDEKGPLASYDSTCKASLCGAFVEFFLNTVEHWGHISHYSLLDAMGGTVASLASELHGKEGILHASWVPFLKSGFQPAKL